MTSQGSMENILTSIRDSVEQESAKVANGVPQEDVLELAVDDILDGAGDGETGAAAANGEEFVDIAAFAANGEEVVNAGAPAADEDVLGENMPIPDEQNESGDVGGADGGESEASEEVSAVKEQEPSAAEASGEIAPSAPAEGENDEFDKLLAELEQGGELPSEAVAEPAMEAEESVPVKEEESARVQEDAMEDVLAGIPAEENVETSPMMEAVVESVAAGDMVELAAIEGTGGLQVAFPAEVLAAALRPMVRDWVAKNLPAVVEKLVREEIGKLSAE
ncbi:MAG: DUF2497 domain-containing protein [Pseudomonadaceae bacterium]|nr:DUF2497 domain-containing protein [Pseudomonadaceae bacterium]